MNTDAPAVVSNRRPRTRYYDAIEATEDGHPVDVAVQRWLPYERGRVVSLQDRVLAALAPEARRAFLELEEVRNEIAAEREEAFYDLGVAVGLEHERRRPRKLLARGPRLAARVDRWLRRAELEPREAALVLAVVLARWASSLPAGERKSRRRRGACPGST